jgi:hypothetical protein
MSRTDADDVFMKKYDHDRRSIFVGGLPYDTEKEEVADLFATIGEVVDVNVVTRPYWHGQLLPVSQVWPRVLTISQAMFGHLPLWSSPAPMRRIGLSRSW